MRSLLRSAISPRRRDMEVCAPGLHSEGLRHSSTYLKRLSTDRKEFDTHNNLPLRAHPAELQRGKCDWTYTACCSIPSRHPCTEIGCPRKKGGKKHARRAQYAHTHAVHGAITLTHKHAQTRAHTRTHSIRMQPLCHGRVSSGVYRMINVCEAGDRFGHHSLWL